MSIHPGFSEAIHLGAGKVKPDEARIFNYYHDVATRKLAGFIEFADTTGLTEPDQQLTFSLLRELFAYTSQHWEPGNCYFATTAMLGLCHKREVVVPDNVVVSRVYTGGHAWLQVETHGSGNSIVFDPTGLPIDMSATKKPSRKDFQPYFGLPQHASKHLRQYYQSAVKYITPHINPAVSLRLEYGEIETVPTDTIFVFWGCGPQTRFVTEWNSALLVKK